MSDVTELFEIIIEDIKNYQENENKKYSIKKIKSFDSRINLLYLSENKNIVNINNDIILYDNLFEEKKEISLNSKMNEFIKINENKFACLNSITQEISVYTLEEDFIDKNIIKNCGKDLVYFLKNKKILISQDDYFFYLINFNSFKPEVIQKIQFKFSNISNNSYNSSYKKNSDSNYITRLIKLFNFYNDDSIFIEYNEEIYKNYSIYRITYLVQYKIIEYELIELSRIVLKSKMLDDEMK